VRNPLVAQGGTLPEPINEVKMFAPGAFRKKMERAIIPGDYATLAKQENPALQNAVAESRWTGSWYEMQVAVDHRDTEEVNEVLKDQVENSLYPFRRIGYDLKVIPAKYVPLDVTLEICVQPGYLRAHVKAALLDRFSNHKLANGQPGYFHPDNLSFGDSIALSKIVAVAQGTPGVASVDRLSILVKNQLFVWPGDTDPNTLEDPIIPLALLEIARVDNDPSFPENGTFKVDLRGGR
jgi:predicted phage baseplate assembly protein